MTTLNSCYNCVYNEDRLHRPNMLHSACMGCTKNPIYENNFKLKEYVFYMIVRKSDGVIMDNLLETKPTEIMEDEELIKMVGAPCKEFT